MSRLPRLTDYELPSGLAAVPPSPPGWRLDPARAALLVHDMQEYFLRAFAPGSTMMAAVIGHIAALRSACHRGGIPVFYTAQPPRQDPTRRGLQADFWGPGMQTGADARIVERLAPRERDRVLVKWRYSAFQKSDFESRLRDAGCDQLLITGVYAHIGCLVTAADAFMRDVRPFMVADAMAAFSRADHDRALAQAAGSTSVVVSTAAVLADLGAAQSSGALTLARMKADVADILDEPVSAVAEDGNLIDIGLDSIRLMMLVERWKDAGASLQFAELAEWPELRRWWSIVETRRRGDAGA